jgi:hypothetical protein
MHHLQLHIMPKTVPPAALKNVFPHFVRPRVRMLRFRSLQPALRAAASARATLHLHAAAPLVAPGVCVRRFGWFSAAPAVASTTAPAAAATSAVGGSSAGAAAAAAPVVAAAPANNVVGIAAEIASQSAAVTTGTSASAASGIGWPTDWLEALLNSLHSSAGLPWWVTIACATVIFRSAMIPLVVKQMRNIGQVLAVLLRRLFL